jgi:hypothetical protein
MTIVYDKAKWHFERFDQKESTKHLASEQAFVHTGMYWGWIMERGLHDEDAFGDDEKFRQSIRDFRARKLTGPQVYESQLDGVLADDLLNEQGKDFTNAYFVFEKGLYLRDYEELLGQNVKELYEVKDSWENYEKIRARIDARFGQWKKGILRSKAEEIYTRLKRRQYWGYGIVLVYLIIHVLIHYWNSTK